MLKGCAFLQIFLGCVCSLTAAQNRQFVYMIWRHGDRAPEHIFDGIPVDVAKAFPNGLANLTAVGISQAKALGESIRQRYFTDPTSAEKVQIRSTNRNRTIETAESVIKGLGIPHLSVKADVPNALDVEGNPFFQCARAEEIERNLGDTYFLRNEYQDVYELMEKKLNYSGHSYPVLDQILCLMANELSIPEWSKNETIMARLKELSWIKFEAKFGMIRFKNAELSKLRGGGILSGVVNRLSEHVGCNTSKPSDICRLQFVGLSAHDITISALLSTFPNPLKILGEVPNIGYGANIAFELWNFQGNYKLKVLYANSYKEAPQDVTKYAPGCEDSDGYCNVHNFLKAAKGLIYEGNLMEQCSKTQHTGRQKRHARYFDENLAEYFMSESS